MGRMLPRERIAAVLDAGSFVEFERHVLHRHPEESESLAANRHPGDGVIAGLGKIVGETVAIYAHDPTVMRGALGITASRKVCRVLDMASERRLPVIALVDCDGVRVEEGTDAIEAYGQIIARTVRMKSRCLQVTAVFGLCVGAAAYTATLTDWVAMVDGHGFMFITGPKVTKVVTGEDVELSDLGGAAMHARRTGACHHVAANDGELANWVRQLVASRHDVAASDPLDRNSDRVAEVVPDAQRRAYDMRKVLDDVFDRGSFFELAAHFGGSLLTGLVRLGGKPLAIVASQPMVLGGCLDVDASRKGAHFIEWANREGMPIVTLVDVPGYLPGLAQEQGGIIPFGAELLTAYGNAKVPLICLVVRKSFGGASVLSFSASVRLALPTARIAPMGIDAMAEVVLGPEVPGMTEDELRARASRRNEWVKGHDNAWAPAEAGYIDRVVLPEDARRSLVAVVQALDERDERRTR
jgi:propionyl-CoA carboxylase beta chain